ncbi:unnamed protein product [Adineta ricciae]|uniref:Uncharacterized protein n=2 Tax=Adineta ricciae TaxID=249248 RepID=A0A815EKK0_ADIRI|nr:unnamed protein product [Adineta ricciae]
MSGATEDVLLKQELHFRGLLLKLQDSLTDTDRCRLHFLFGNVIPRRLRDDPSIGGTLNLLESLFDRGLINDQDFDYLIQAFRQIQRHDIVQRLESQTGDTRKSKGEATLWRQMINDNEEDRVCYNALKESEELSTPSVANPTQNSPARVTEDVRETTIVSNQLIKLKFRETLKAYISCRTLIIFNIISILFIIASIIALFIRVQIIPSGGPDSNDCRSFQNQDIVSKSPIVLAYYLSWWTDRNYTVEDIPVNKITHLNYAFAYVDARGRIALNKHTSTENMTNLNQSDAQMPENLKQIIELKNQYPHLRTLISVGGDTFQENFKKVVVSNRSRSIFASSCIEFMEKYHFDGIDLNWRDPMSDSWPNHSGSLEDKQRNLYLFLKELRRQLDTKYFLTLATGVNPDHISKMNLPKIIDFVDWINVVTYNFHNNQELQTGHNAPLYKNDNETLDDASASSYTSKMNCHAAIQAYLSARVPPNKIVMGIPLYGHGWQEVTNTTLNGFLQAASSVPPNGTWGDGSFDYDDIKNDVIRSYTRYWDDQSKVPFLFNSSTGIWISYEDLESVKWKCDYMKKYRLAGAFFWELSKDRKGELIGATFNALNKDIDVLSMNRLRSWKANAQYYVDDHVKYDDKIYRCIRSHKSVVDQTPPAENSLWSLEYISVSTASTRV